MGERNVSDKKKNSCPNVSSNNNKENNKKQNMIELNKQDGGKNGIKGKSELKNKNIEGERIEDLKKNIIIDDKLNNNEKDANDETNGDTTNVNGNNNNTKLEQKNDQKNECKRRKENKYIKYIKEIKSEKIYGNGKLKGQIATQHGSKHKLLNNNEDNGEEPESKLKTFRTRSYWSLVLSFFFLFLY